MADQQKPKRYKSNDSVGESLRKIVRDIGYLASPRVVRERKNDVDDAVDRRYDNQTSDSNNRY